jgi:hypothetical protein
MTSPAVRIREELRSYSWRIRIWRGLQLSLWSILGAQILFVGAALSREGTSLVDVLQADAIVLGAAAAICGLVGFLSPLPRVTVARFLDAALGLKERVQTALELDDRNPFAKIVSADALDHLRHAATSGYHAALFKNLQWRWPLVVCVAGAAILMANPMARSLLSPQSSGDTVQTRMNQSPAESKSAIAASENRPLTANINAKILTADPEFRDTPIAAEPMDFESFVGSGGDDLEFLDAKPGSTNGSSPASMARMKTDNSPPSFEAGSSSTEDRSERMANLEALLSKTSKGSQSGQKKSGDKAGSGTASDAEAGDGDPTSDESSAQAQQHANAAPVAQSDKGLAKESLAPDKETEGTLSSEEIQAPSRAATKPLDGDDTQTARYGGGQYPHNAPGAGFPDWMRGDEDPHFMDAGQGEGKSTGKTSGQAGVGHAVPKKGPEGEKENVRTAEDLFLPGKRSRDGEKTSYDTEALAPASKSSSAVPEDTLATKYAAQAEEQMSRNHVPLELRAQVRAYFSEIK